MADEKTEQPTPKKLRDVRQKGQVAKSQDIPPAATVMAIALYLLVMGEDIAKTMIAMVQAPLEFLHVPFRESALQVAAIEFSCALSIVLPIVAVVMAVALASILAQIGVLFAPEGATPKLENLNPSQWFKKVFSVKNLFELLKNILKVTILSLAVYTILEDALKDLFRIPQSTILSLWSMLGMRSFELIITAASILAVLAAFDFFFQKWQFTKNNMMSKDEVKREYKESEGDPLIKSKRKQLHQEMLRQNNLQNVRKAKVLVVNPTHYAVALDYEKERTPLPVITAKGEGELALRMIQAAKEAGVPIMHNVQLARSLYSEGTENAYIPRDFIAPVAEVLRWVEGLKK